MHFLLDKNSHKFYVKKKKKKNSWTFWKFYLEKEVFYFTSFHSAFLCNSPKFEYKWVDGHLPVIIIYCNYCFILYLNMDRKIQIFPEALDLILEQKQ